MSLKISLEKGLDRIAQNSSDDMFLTIYLEPLFKVGYNLDESTLQDISTIDNPLIKAIHRYLSWELYEKGDFTKIIDFFAFLRESINEYSEKGGWNIVSLCFKQLISKGIRFGQDEILKLDIEKFKNLLDEINELPFRNQYTILRARAKNEAAKPARRATARECLEWTQLHLFALRRKTFIMNLQLR